MGTAMGEVFLPRRATWIASNNRSSTFLDIFLSVFLSNILRLLGAIFSWLLLGFVLLLGFWLVLLLSIGSSLLRRSLLSIAVDVPTWAITGYIGTYEGFQLL